MMAWAMAMPSELLSASIAASLRSQADRARAAPSRFTISDEAFARPFFQMIIGHLGRAPRISSNAYGAACTPPHKRADSSYLAISTGSTVLRRPASKSPPRSAQWPKQWLRQKERSTSALWEAGSLSARQ
jgi:hypothetical protein